MSSKPLDHLKFKMMAAGDSITTGWEPYENAYRKDLLDSLPGNEIDMVGPDEYGSMKPGKLNRMDARIGRKIRELHDALEKSLPEWKPDVILLHIGTNDIAGHDPLPPGLDDQVDEILELAHNTCPLAIVLVALIIPAAFHGDRINEFNNGVKGRVEKRQKSGERLTIVDMFKDWPDDTLRDLAHPNDKGYREMAKRWKLGLEEANGHGWLA